MLRFTILGSGSTGNATLIEGVEQTAGAPRPTRVLIDCGLTARELTRRLAERSVSIDEIDAVFITHEHSDHLGCIASLMRRTRMLVWTSAGTWRAGARRTAELPSPSTFARDGEVLQVGAIELRPFAVPHDAQEPLQVVASDGHRRLGIVTDLGHPNESVAQALQGCDALVLEANHDEAMLESGPYPHFLKRRIAGPHGHLANAQSMSLLAACRHAGLQRTVAAHLSQHNNTPELARGALAQVLGCLPQEIDVAHPVQGTCWIDV